MLLSAQCLIRKLSACKLTAFSPLYAVFFEKLAVGASWITVSSISVSLSKPRLRIFMRTKNFSHIHLEIMKLSTSLAILLRRVIQMKLSIEKEHFWSIGTLESNWKCLCQSTELRFLLSAVVNSVYLQMYSKPFFADQWFHSTALYASS